MHLEWLGLALDDLDGLSSLLLGRELLLMALRFLDASILAVVVFLVFRVLGAVLFAATNGPAGGVVFLDGIVDLVLFNDFLPLAFAEGLLEAHDVDGVQLFEV